MGTEKKWNEITSETFRGHNCRCEGNEMNAAHFIFDRSIFILRVATTQLNCMQMDTQRNNSDGNFDVSYSICMRIWASTPTAWNGAWSLSQRIQFSID